MMQCKMKKQSAYTFQTKKNVKHKTIFLISSFFLCCFSLCRFVVVFRNFYFFEEKDTEEKMIKMYMKTNTATHVDPEKVFPSLPIYTHMCFFIACKLPCVSTALFLLPLLASSVSFLCSR